MTYPADGEAGKPVRAVSNPVEITIEPREESKKKPPREVDEKRAPLTQP